jgi:hypothetical protein
MTAVTASIGLEKTDSNSGKGDLRKDAQPRLDRRAAARVVGKNVTDAEARG